MGRVICCVVGLGACATTPVWHPVLEAEGGEPRVLLGAPPPEGAAQSLRVHAEVTATLRGGEQWAATTTTFELRLSVAVAPGESGPGVLDLRVEEVRLVRAGPPIQLGGFGLHADLPFLGLEGATCRFIRGSFAIGRVYEFEAPNLLEHEREAAQAALAELLTGLGVRAPPTPLGAGARWRVGEAPLRCELREILEDEAQVACAEKRQEPGEEGLAIEGSWIGFVRPSLPLARAVSYERVAERRYPNGIVGRRVLTLESSDE